MARRKKNTTGVQYLKYFAIAMGTYVVIKAVKASATPVKTTKREKVSEAEQVVRAYWLQENTTLASILYRIRWPNCPEKLDPEDPNHADCVEKWKKALVDIEAARAKYPSNFYWLNQKTFPGKDWEYAQDWTGGGAQRIVLMYEQPIPTKSVNEMLKLARQHPGLTYVLVEWLTDNKSMPYHMTAYYGPRIYDTVIAGSMSVKHINDQLNNYTNRLLKKLGKA